MQWAKVKKAGLAPSPPRSSFGLAVHRQGAYLFGGITDRAGAKDAVYSEMYNELYQFQLGPQRWFPVSVRAPKGQVGPLLCRSVPVASYRSSLLAKSTVFASLCAAAATRGALEQSCLSRTGAYAAWGQVPAQAEQPSSKAAAWLTGRELQAKKEAQKAEAAAEAAVDAAAADPSAGTAPGLQDRGSALYKAAVRIQACYRGYAVRKVRAWDRPAACTAQPLPCLSVQAPARRQWGSRAALRSWKRRPRCARCRAVHRLSSRRGPSRHFAGLAALAPT